MTAAKITRDDEFAKTAENALRALLQVHGLPGIAGGAHGGGPLSGMISSPDQPLVVELSDGRELHFAITAYGPAGS